MNVRKSLLNTAGIITLSLANIISCDSEDSQQAQVPKQEIFQKSNQKEVVEGNIERVIQENETPSELTTIWAKEIKNVHPEDIRMAIGEDGLTYLAGTTKMPIDKNSDVNIAIFLAKLDRDGDKVWIKQYGTSKVNMLGGFIVEKMGNLYMLQSDLDIAKDKEGNAIIDGGKIRFNSRAFLVKYNDEGKEIWKKRLAINEHSKLESLTINKDYIHVIGENENGVFIEQYKGDGKQTWCERQKIKCLDTIISDEKGNIYAAGNMGPLGGNEVVVEKYNPSGRTIGLRGFGIKDKYLELLHSNIDKMGNPYFIGSATGKTNDPTNGNCLSKLDKECNVLWSKIIINMAYVDVGNKLVFDKDNNIYIIGVGNNMYEPKKNGSIIAKYDNNGNEIWRHPFKKGFFAQDIKIDDYDNLYITGERAWGGVFISKLKQK